MIQNDKHHREKSTSTKHQITNKLEFQNANVPKRLLGLFWSFQILKLAFVCDLVLVIWSFDLRNIL
jgi:hypothetical protein